MTAHDAHGNPMTGDADTIRAYDEALDRFLRFHPDLVPRATALATAERPAPMASALWAYLHLMGTNADDLATATEAHRALAASAVTERERGHADAIGAWVTGDWHGAARRLDDVLARWPTDLLALMFGHQLDFFVGDAQGLRDRPLRSLASLGDHPHAGFARGMAAFGLEEAGQYDQALDAGLAAVADHPDDVWAIHAVVHTHEMRGAVDTGIRFLRSPDTAWESGNLFTVHNWWHLALYQLEAGRPDEALAIYDAEIHHDQSENVPIEMLDASALLWRLHLDGVDTGDRFAVLAEAWTPHTGRASWYAFNDVHAAMALVGAGRLDDARAVADRLAADLPTTAGSNARFAGEVGLPAARAVVAFGAGRHADVVELLGPIRDRLHVFGGSHAQRDAFQRTLLESSLRAGHYELAASLTAERLATRDTSVYGWTQRARALAGLGDETGAAAAAANASTHRSRFAAVES